MRNSPFAWSARLALRAATQKIRRQWKTTWELCIFQYTRYPLCYNSSKTLDGHTIPQYAKDVRAVIDALKLKDVTLVGWSLAGPVVLEYWKQFGADKVKAEMVSLQPLVAPVAAG